MATRIIQFVLVEMMFFLLLTLIVTTPTHPAQAGTGPPRSMWVWDDSTVTDADARDALLNFANRKGVDQFYLNAYLLLPNHPTELQTFINQASTISTSVELLAGDPTWALSSTHAVALEFARQAITFTHNITAGAKPAGIHLDVEPYALSNWNDPVTLTQYLDLLASVQQDVSNSGTALSFTVDIPFWFDAISLTYRGTFQPLNRHVQSLTDRVVVMDYRDTATGTDGIIAHAQNEVAAGQSLGKPVIIGVETQKITPEKITFFEEGETAMETELAATAQQFQANPVFAGFAVHHYTSWLQMTLIFDSWLPIILKEN